MEFIINFTQTSTADMRINLRCGDLTVAQHELNRPQISPSFQEMRGKGMPQYMWTNL